VVARAAWYVSVHFIVYSFLLDGKNVKAYKTHAVISIIATVKCLINDE